MNNSLEKSHKRHLRSEMQIRFAIKIKMRIGSSGLNNNGSRDRFQWRVGDAHSMT